MSIFATGLPINKLTKVVPVFITINNEYASYAAAAVHALEMRSDKRRYYRVIILHDGLSLPNRVRLRSLATKNVAVQFKKISSNLYLKAIVAYCARQRRGTADWFAKAVYYYRAFIPRLFPQYEKAIYIDSDAIYKDDYEIIVQSLVNIKKNDLTREQLVSMERLISLIALYLENDNCYLKLLMN